MHQLFNRSLFKPGSVFKLIGMDPGLMRFGLSVIEVDCYTREIVSFYSTTYYGNKLKGNKYVEESQGERLCILRALIGELEKEFEQHSALAYAIESPFYSMSSPSAFGSLNEIVSLVKQLVINHDDSKTLSLIDPPTVKKNIGAKGNADKTIVRENILQLFSNVNNLSLLDIESLDEHSIDSLAVSYSLYINYKECL